MGRNGFKAVIVGGGVGGLTLANIFEKLDIDYVLLESHGNIAPQVGASIAMLPHGQRILDQIGCRDRFLEGVPSLNHANLAKDGKALLQIVGYNDVLVKRLGDGIAFNDRQILLQVLYDNLKDKNKVLIGKRVAKVSTSDSGASVETRDGEVFSGDIVVGLDGIRSTVRAEMWRIAAETAPDYFPKDEMKRVPIDFKCLYGISRPDKNISPGMTVITFGRGSSNLIVGGPGGKVYYFLFVRLPKTVYGDNAPRYSQDDARELAKLHHKDPIINGCTLGGLFDNSISFGMTPLHEHVFAKWHFGRIITLGDAAHKPHPISGLGGNGAIESVAELANQLKRRLDALPASGRLSSADVDAVFGGTQAVRHERAERFVKYSRKQQAMNAPSGALGPALIRLAPWMVSHEKVREGLTNVTVDAVHIDALPMRFRPHFIPWRDELPARPLERKNALPVRLAFAAALLALSWMAGFGLRGPGELPTTLLGHPIREVYTGHQAVDATLAMLTKVFSLIVASPNPEHRLQLIYFLPMLAPVIVIWLAEAHRRGNLQTIRGTWVRWPGIWAIGYQLFAIARVGPLYFLVTLIISANSLYYRQTSRAVDPVVARALLPAVGLGYVLPTVFMLLPLWSSPGIWLDFTTLWQVAPVLAGPLAAIFVSLARSCHAAFGSGKGEEASADPDREIYRNRDLPHLLTAYSALGYAAAALHVSALVYALATPAVSLFRAFFDVPCWPWLDGAATWEVGMGDHDAVAVLFKWDLMGFAAALLVWCLFNVFEMRRVGYVTTPAAWRAAAAVAASLVLVGPGAMYAGTWYWREKTIASLSKLEEDDKKTR